MFNYIYIFVLFYLEKNLNNFYNTIIEFIKTTFLFLYIMPIVSDHLRSLFNRHRKTDLIKGVNAENAVRQSSRDSAINNNDNNFVT